MDRSAWLREIRKSSEAQETLAASGYDDQWGAVAPTHQRFFERFLDLCPPGGRILDAACGTGKYWPLILASGRTVLGIDQSRGVLARAREKFPDVPSERIGLQEMSCEAAFAGAICMDAMEMVPPEDWPFVLNNLYRAIAGTGYLYFTVEIAEEQELAKALAEGRQMGLPVVLGEAEWVMEGGYAWGRNGFYHYYPGLEQVKKWLQPTGFELIEHDVGDDYHHFLMRKP